MLLVNHPAAANENAGECQDGGRQSRETPKSLCKPAESAKVQLGQPEQALVGETVGGIEDDRPLKGRGNEK